MTSTLRYRIAVLALTGLLVSCYTSRAEVTVHPLFSDNMILQRDKPLPVWGTARAGESVTVSLDRQKKATTADAAGNWRVVLNKQRVARNLTLTVKGDNEVSFKNIALGDVYVCSGQSNMEWPLDMTNGGRAEVGVAKFPDMRLFSVPRKIAGTPQSGFAAPVSWQVCTPLTVPGFSAVGYYFGRELHQKLGIPIGLINSSWGGTYAQAWSSPQTLSKREDLRDAVKQTAELLQSTTDTSVPAGGPDPRTNPNQPAVLYNGMIAPLVNFPVRGAIWYQGESNAGDPVQYQTLFPDLIRGWRESWSARQDGGDFGFYFVQLANFTPRVAEPVQTGWAELREAQFMALRLPRTGMATILDIGDAEDIHPRNKKDVGKRLALAALHTEYGRKIEYSGPVFHSLRETKDGRETQIRWHHAAGLGTADGKAPRGFAIQGADGKWHAAQAKIEGDSVIIWGNVKPVAVRYAWANNPDVNLVNGAGLPAVPFRTDTPK